MYIADHVDGHAILDVDVDQTLLLHEVGMRSEDDLPNVPCTAAIGIDVHQMKPVVMPYLLGMVLPSLNHWIMSLTNSAVILYFPSSFWGSTGPAYVLSTSQPPSRRSRQGRAT